MHLTVSPEQDTIKIFSEINSEYYDISPEISPETTVWPGDVKFSRRLTTQFTEGENYLLSSIESTLHLGAHTDAPNHYNPEGIGISKRPLHYYFGLAQVIEVSLARAKRIFPLHIQNTPIVAKRILFKTSSFPNPTVWNSDFNSLSAELIEDLAKRGVILVGIDTPSVDLFDDKGMSAHHAIDRNNMANLEGIVLSDVPAGTYHLCALPLKIRDADASPVRAILNRIHK